MASSYIPPVPYDSKMKEAIAAALFAASAASSAATAASSAATAAASAAASAVAAISDLNALTDASLQKEPSPELEETPFPFMDLPSELRCEVYKYLLVVGKVFFTKLDPNIHHKARYKDHQAYRKPDLAILRVSKEVCAEAEDIYFTYNMFVLPVRFEEYARNSREVPESRRRVLFSKRAWRKIRHLGVEVSSMGAQFVLEEEASELAHSLTNIRWRPSYIHDEQREYIHEKTLRKAEDIVEHVFAWLMDMKEARTIEIDFTSAYCPLACCRLLFQTCMVYVLARMEKVRILGLSDEPEEDEFTEEWGQHLTTAVGIDYGDEFEPDLDFYEEHTVEELHKRHEITFGPEGDPWVEHKMNTKITAKKN